MTEYIYPRHDSAIICGIMTGTSLDGIDIAVVDFCGSIENPDYKLLLFGTIPYRNELKNKISDAIDCRLSTDGISRLNFDISADYFEAIVTICRNNGFDPALLDAIGMHGQTVWHEPPSEKSAVASSLQLGSGPALANLSGIPVVYDFRSADIALGGQGAPLVPVFDYNFLKSKTKNRIVLNIGGISNITCLPRSCARSQVKAFDTGPGNVWIDSAMKILFNTNFDLNGKTGSSGKLIPGFDDDLKRIGFIYEKPPKSTGRELFTFAKIKSLIEKYSASEPEDIIRTLTYFTARSIAENIKLFATFPDELIYSGGGALNKTLIELLKNELPGVDFHPSDEFGIPYDGKEAICFAYLAYRTLNGLPGNLPSVTGAKKEAILGSIAPVYI